MFAVSKYCPPPTEAYGTPRLFLFLCLGRQEVTSKSDSSVLAARRTSFFSLYLPYQTQQFLLGGVSISATLSVFLTTFCLNLWGNLGSQKWTWNPGPQLLSKAVSPMPLFSLKSNEVAGLGLWARCWIFTSESDLAALPVQKCENLF